MRQGKTEKWKYTIVQKPKLTYFLLNLRQRMFFGDKLTYVPADSGETWARFLHYCMQVRLGANCPKNTCRKIFLATPLGKLKRLVAYAYASHHDG
jgi:hypothetical protein